MTENTQSTESQLFNELLNESYEGNFTYEPNELTEIHVNYSNQSIVVEVYRLKNHMVSQEVKTETFSCLYGMLGYKSVEEMFNKILKGL